MEKDRVQAIKDLHNDLLDKPRQVYSIFSDYYREDRVELQGCLTENELINILNQFCYDDLCVSAILMTEERWNSIRYKSLMELSDEEFVKIINILPVLIKDWHLNLPYILINFGDITVTNEYGKSIDIQGLWVKVWVSYNGTGSNFALNRSEYTVEQFLSDYMHSHVHLIPKDDFTEFQIPCLGSGPIKRTLSNLTVDYDEVIWQLFCYELDKYVRTESIAGVPYHRLENIRRSSYIEVIKDFRMSYSNRFPDTYKPILKEFVKYFIKQKKLQFNYSNGSYGLGMDFIDYMILVSNEFISWYNQLDRDTDKELIMSQEGLLGIGLLIRCKISDRSIYIENENQRVTIQNLTDITGAYICTFKGKPVTLKIKDIGNGSNDNYVLLLNVNIAERILQYILGIINIKYGKEQYNDNAINGNAAFSEGNQEIAGTYQGIRIL